MLGKEAAIALGYSQKSSALIISIGITLGAALLWLIHNKFPLLVRVLPIRGQALRLTPS